MIWNWLDWPMNDYNLIYMVVEYLDWHKEDGSLQESSGPCSLHPPQ